MKKLSFSLISILFLSLFLSGCATKVAEINGQSYSDKDEVLMNLDIGMMEFYNEDYPAAIRHLTIAEDKIFEYYSKSISQNIESFIVNDLVIDYPGEDYEDIYLNLFKAMSYYLNDQWEEGFHELNAYKRKANFLAQKHAEEIEKARNEAKVYDSAYSSVQFHDSALAEYLFMLYYRSLRDRNQVEYAARMLKDVFATSPNIYNFNVPESIDEELAVEMFDTRINFLVCSGVSPYKQEIITHSHEFTLALPALVIPEENVSEITVLAKNIETGKVYREDLQKIEDMGNVAYDVFKSRADLIYLKSVARATTKAVITTTGEVTGSALMQSNDDTVAAIGTIIALASLAGRVATEVNEHADIRHSSYFPGRADVGGMSVIPGLYNIIVQYKDNSGNVIFTDKIANQFVEAGKLNLVTSSSTMKEYNAIKHHKMATKTRNYYYY